MTVGDEAQVKRPRMSPEKRAALGGEAWRLMDTENMSSRTIADKFTKRGDPVSHVTVIEMVKEARVRAKYLDLVAPAELRAGQLGRFETYLEEVRAQIKTGLLDPDKGWSLIATFERLLMTVGGSAMPSRVQVESTGDAPTPNMATMRAFAEAVDDYDQRKQQIQATDGLEEYDS